MAEIDLENVQAGEYVLVVDSWDEITSKPGEPYDFVTHHKGDVVDLDKAEARRLLAGDAVVSKKDYEKAKEAATATSSPISVLDAEGIANLREKLDLDEDAGQAEILEALESHLEDVTPAKPAAWWGDGDEPTTIEAIEKRIDGDKALAAAALAAEYSSSSPRTTLLDKLTAVLAAS